MRLVTEDKRFKVIPAGRRSGKTERFKRYLTREANKFTGERYFAGAPTRKQVKDIFWNDLKLLTFSHLHRKKPSETDLEIYMPNGTTISLVSMDEPARFEGIPWTGGGFDESGNIKEHAWESNIFPALDTIDPRRPDYRAWCWIFGVPEGLNRYSELYNYAKTSNDPEWGAYHWISADYLPEDVIAAARRRMSPKQFRQEYEASFETTTGRIYEDYSKENHTDAQPYPHEKLLWCHDQNFTPLSSAICVRRDDNIYVTDEIVLESAVSKQSAVEFVERYRNHENKSVIIYGDPAGRAGEKHGHGSDYVDLERVLGQAGWDFERRVARAHPPIKDRQNAVRARICNADGDRRLFVNPSKAVYCDKGLFTVTVKEGSAFQEDQRNKYQHITTAIGYMTHYEFPIEESIGQIDVGWAR